MLLSISRAKRRQNNAKILRRSGLFWLKNLARNLACNFPQLSPQFNLSQLAHSAIIQFKIILNSLDPTWYHTYLHLRADLESKPSNCGVMVTLSTMDMPVLLIMIGDTDGRK
jgi:hypothetical protein